MSIKNKIYPLNRIIPLTKISQEPFLSRIAIASKGEIRVIELDHILYLKSDSNYTEIYLRDDHKLVSSFTLKKYEDKLDPDSFIRVHNSYIIRRSQIESYSFKKNSVTLLNSQEIPVSRSKKEELLSYLKTLTL